MSISIFRSTTLKPLVEECQKNTQLYEEIDQKVRQVARTQLAQKVLDPSNIGDFIQNEIKHELRSQGLENYPTLSRFVKYLGSIRAPGSQASIIEAFINQTLKPPKIRDFLEGAKQLPWDKKALLFKNTLEHLIFQKFYLEYSKVDIRLDKEQHAYPSKTTWILFPEGDPDNPQFYPAFFDLSFIPQVPESEEGYFFNLINMTIEVKKCMKEQGRMCLEGEKISWETYHRMYREYSMLKVLKKRLKNCSPQLKSFLEYSTKVLQLYLARHRYAYFYERVHTSIPHLFDLNTTNYYQETSLEACLLKEATRYLDALSLSYLLDIQCKDIKAGKQYALANPLDKQLYTAFYTNSFEDKEKIYSSYETNKKQVQEFYKKVHQQLEKLKKEHSLDSLSSVVDDKTFLGITGVQRSSAFDFQPALTSYTPAVSWTQFDTSFNSRFNETKGIYSQKGVLSLPTPAASPALKGMNLPEVEEEHKEPRIQKAVFEEQELFSQLDIPATAIDEGEGEWQSVLPKSISAFEKDFKYSYAPRVARWFPQDPSQALCQELFPEYQAESLDYQKKMVHYHAFAPVVDRYLSMGKVLSGKTSQAKGLLTDEDRQKDRAILFIGLPAKLKLKESPWKYGLLLYKINKQSNTVVHRYFHPLNSNKELFDTFITTEKMQKICEENEEKGEEKQSPLPFLDEAYKQRYQVKQKDSVLEIKDLRTDCELRVFSTKQ